MLTFNLQLSITSRLLRMVPTNSKVFLCGLLNMREKQILRSGIENFNNTC